MRADNFPTPQPSGCWFGDITKAVHNKGSESCTDTTAILMQKVLPEGDQNAGSFNAGFQRPKSTAKPEHRERYRTGDTAADIGEYLAAIIKGCCRQPATR